MNKHSIESKQNQQPTLRPQPEVRQPSVGQAAQKNKLRAADMANPSRSGGPSPSLPDQGKPANLSDRDQQDRLMNEGGVRQPGQPASDADTKQLDRPSTRRPQQG